MNASNHRKTRAFNSDNYNKWTSERGLSILSSWFRNGYTVRDLCKQKLHVTEMTFYNWCKKCPKLKEVSMITREEADNEIENSMFKTAQGFEYEEEELTKIGTVVRVKKFLPPNPKAQEMWLRNRKSSIWRKAEAVNVEVNNANEPNEQDASSAILGALKAREIGLMKKQEETEDKSNG